MKTVSIAASFIVTVGLLSGCGSSHPPHGNPPAPDSHKANHQNPPGPESHDHAGHDHGDGHQNPPGPGKKHHHKGDKHEGHGDHHNPPAPKPEGSDHGHINPPAPKPVDAASLPAAAEGEKVSKSADGTCWVAHDVKCPEGAACNPPAPKQVKCPAE